MLEAWSDTEEQRVLDEGCWAERLRALEDLACEQAEDHVFAWELAACPIWTTFRSIGEPCGLFEGALASSCEAGLVCDHRSKRCVDASTPVAVGTPCLESADEYGSRGYCGTAGRCDEMGVCQVDDGSAHEPLPVLVCSSSVRVF